MVNAPLYGLNDKIYLLSSSLVGNIESYTVDSIYWDNNINSWIYMINIKPTPKGPMHTVGDRIDLRDKKILKFAESELTDVCTALQNCRDYYANRLSRLQSRYNYKCSDSSTSQ